jgi:tetratricopeptide (TPR) repeat protein
MQSSADLIRRKSAEPGLALTRLFLPCLLVLIIVTYFSAIDGPFQYDDHHSIVDNPHIRSLQGAVSFLWSPQSFSEDPRSAMYRPLVLISYALNYALHGYETSGYHLLNIAIHLLNCCLVYLLVRRFDGGLVGAATASALFALHPVNGEAVVYISSRSESLCATFYILAVLLYRPVEGSRSGLDRWTVLSTVSFAFALMSKSVAITLPALLLVSELLRHRADGVPSRLRQLLTRHWPFLLISSLYLLSTADVVSRAIDSDSVRGLAQQLGTQTKALVYYASLLSLPAKLSVEHQFSVAPGLLSIDVMVPGLVILSVAVTTWRCRSALGARSVWTVWPLIVLLPTLVIPLNVLVNEHHLYLPLIAFAALLGAVFEKLIDSRRHIGLLAAAILIALYATLSHERSLVWRDSFTLWSDALVKGPYMPRPHVYVGDSYHSGGEYGRAVTEYRTALEIHPEVLSPLDRVVALNNMGASYLKMGSFTEAVHAYQRAVRVDSSYLKSRDALDALLALQEDAGSSRAKELYKRGLVQFAAGKSAEAVVSFSESLAIHSLDRTWHALALAYERLETWEDAAKTYEVLEMVATRATLRATAAEGIARTRARAVAGERYGLVGERGGA